MTVIVDYGCGNPASIRNMLMKLGYPSSISSDLRDIRAAQRLILPGVGAFDHGMEQLESLGLRSVLDDKALGEKVPVLGICLGAQLFARSSEEGARSGLAWIDAKVVRFDRSLMKREHKIPHMSWATVDVKSGCRLFDGYEAPPRFYFVHAYHLACECEEVVVATASHGYDFPAALESGNILGVQFHPEKSHRFGMTMLRNFMTNY